MLLRKGENMTDPTAAPARQALTFYPVEQEPGSFHDDRPDDKAEKGSWSNWRNEQQREFTPGLGQR